MVDRCERRHRATQASVEDSRNPFERDRDRILYTAAFRRLAGVTQVAAPDLAYPLHNRLTHVLEVAQIGRGLAEHLLRDQSQREIADQIGGIDPHVVEAACLAHDLGHPPFGHITEEVLNKAAGDHYVSGGFEGNAQSFRIVTKLAEHRDEFPGLDLTRATLNAMLKYPWRNDNDGKRKHKWGYYSPSEEDDFNWARALDLHTERKSAEAELMDWADDIAYSVHDMVDFFQAGKIPLDRLINDTSEVDRFFEGTFRRWTEEGLHPDEDPKLFKDAFRELIELTVFAIDRPFRGEAEERHAVRRIPANLINRYMNGIKLRVPGGEDAFVEVDQNMAREVAMLKELTWFYVINDPALATQQYGQRHIIRYLYDTYFDVFGNQSDWRLLPPRYREIAMKDPTVLKKDQFKSRLVCDLVASMTEQQAVAMYHRLHGISPGSALAIIVP